MNLEKYKNQIHKILVTSEPFSKEKIDHLRSIIRLSASSKYAHRFSIKTENQDNANILSTVLLTEVIRGCSSVYVSINHANNHINDDVMTELRLALGRGVSLYCFIPDTIGCSKSVDFCNRLIQLGMIYDIEFFELAKETELSASVGDIRMTIIDRGKEIEWSMNDKSFGNEVLGLKLALSKRTDRLPKSNAMIRLSNRTIG